MGIPSISLDRLKNKTFYDIVLCKIDLFTLLKNHSYLHV